MSLKCVIVDDEPTARSIIRNYIARIDHLECVDEFHSAMELYNYGRRTEIDILFLDIEMPEINGLDFASTLPDSLALIYTTAYSQHALQAFDKGAIDYLLKPISFDRFLSAVDKACRYLNYEPTKTTNTNTSGDGIHLKYEGVIQEFKFDDIIYVQSFGNYVKVYTKKKMYLVSDTLKNVENGLPNDNFIQIHRSYIINVHQIKEISDDRLVHIGSKTLPVSKMYKNGLKEKLSE